MSKELYIVMTDNVEESIDGKVMMEWDHSTSFEQIEDLFLISSRPDPDPAKPYRFLSDVAVELFGVVHRWGDDDEIDAIIEHKNACVVDKMYIKSKEWKEV